MKMKFLTTLAALALFIAAPSYAQLSPSNAAGVTYGHTHLNVADINPHKQLFVDALGGELLQRGTRSLIKYPNMIIVFFERKPSAPSQGSVMDHFGFKVQNMAEMRKTLTGMGFEVQEQFTGAEGFPNAYVVGPDGLRLEIQEDKTLKVKAMPNHIHFFTQGHEKLLAWYVDTFSLTKHKRGRIETTADAGTLNLTFWTSKTATLPTKGRAIDHIGFEIDDLEAFTQKLQAKGIKLDVPVRKLPDSDLKYAFITDPNGTYIELTQGLDKY
ncbi:MAG TPA: VOC family protein [Steroidobacteraceae bacterium]|nr:VOC family protein [Steroidobacteraceae bacterium]